MTRPPKVTIATSTRLAASGSAQQLVAVDLQALVELVDPRPVHRRRRVDDQHARHARLGVLGEFDAHSNEVSAEICSMNEMTLKTEEHLEIAPTPGRRPPPLATETQYHWHRHGSQARRRGGFSGRRRRIRALAMSREPIGSDSGTILASLGTSSEVTTMDQSKLRPVTIAKLRQFAPAREEGDERQRDMRPGRFAVSGQFIKLSGSPAADPQPAYLPRKSG